MGEGLKEGILSGGENANGLNMLLFWRTPGKSACKGKAAFKGHSSTLQKKLKYLTPTALAVALLELNLKHCPHVIPSLHAPKMETGFHRLVLTLG